MEKTIFSDLGQQLRSLRETRGWTQLDISSRVGRSPTRISEFERDLASERLGRDRLTLFAAMCDALGVIPVLVPEARVAAVRNIIAERHQRIHSSEPAGSAFDDLFVDLGDEDEDDEVDS
ncbi:helix-turn-helix domain-containing protein [Sphingopyxis fribergensis]|jgi:transcriptional regulator with XRE-family HTH domain